MASRLNAVLLVPHSSAVLEYQFAHIEWPDLAYSEKERGQRGFRLADRVKDAPCAIMIDLESPRGVLSLEE
jgi:hypothetical protein